MSSRILLCCFIPVYLWSTHCLILVPCLVLISSNTNCDSWCMRYAHIIVNWTLFLLWYFYHSHTSLPVSTAKWGPDSCGLFQVCDCTYASGISRKLLRRKYTFHLFLVLPTLCGSSPHNLWSPIHRRMDFIGVLPQAHWVILVLPKVS